MPEFWELCTLESRAILGYLYKQEQGHWPEWDERSGKVRKEPPPIEIPVNTDMEESALARFMSEAPRHQRKIE